MDAQQIVASNSNAKVVHALATLTTVCGVSSFRKANARQLESARRCATCFPTAEAPAPKTTSRKAAKKTAAPVAPVAAPAETPAPAAPAAKLEETEQAWTYRLSQAQVEATIEKFEKMNARAAKKGLSGSWALTKIERVVEKDTHPATGLPIEKVWYECTIGGTAIAFDGWEFIATLDWDEYAGLIVRAMPGAAIVERENLREGWCDHCKTTRRRRVTYVVRDTDNGQQLQVGRSCIKDFTGWPGNIAWLERNNIGDGFFGDAGRIDYTPTTVLATAWAVIKLNGFVPASQYGDKPTTKDLVNIALYPNRKNQKDVDFAETLRPLAQEATARAVEVLEFIASDDFGGTGDYVLNLKAAAAGERVSPRNFGLLVSAPQAHARHLERTLIKATKAKVGENSEYVGRVAAEGEKADRRELEVTVAGIFWRDNPYSTDEEDQTPIYTLVDGDGNVLKWFASTDKLGEEEGARFIVKASIKAHKEWKGTKETHVTRVAVVKELEPLAAE